MTKTEYFYKKYCKLCGKLTDSWKISKEYFNFLRRSPGMKYPEDTPGVVTYDWVCESCAPEYYSDPSWIAPEPFKKAPLPLPKGVVIPTSSSPPTPSAHPVPPAPSTPLAVPAHPAPPARPAVPTRPAPPTRMAAPIPTPCAPPAATPQEPAKASSPTNVEKPFVTKAAPKFNIPKLKGK